MAIVGDHKYLRCGLYLHDMIMLTGLGLVKLQSWQEVLSTSFAYYVVIKKKKVIN